MTLPLVGLTGGIASGKSTVAAAFRDLGVPVIDADVIAREVVERGTPGLAAVVEAFGPEVLDANGELDRTRLGQRVFADGEARTKLNAILHPLIFEATAQRLADLDGCGAAYAMYDAALLVETGRLDRFVALVVVAVHESTQLDRLIKRNGFSEAAARSRIEAQLPLADKLAVADYVIWTDGPVEVTRVRVKEVHDALLTRVSALR